MKRVARVRHELLSYVALLLVAIATTACTPAPAARTASPTTSATAVQVARVVDGDSLRVQLANGDEVEVRLAEIDAPERGQPWGNRSKQALASLVLGKRVDYRAVDLDRYGRTVATVFVDGRNVNEALVEAGHAWAYRKYVTSARIIGLETAAKNARQGLWSLPANETIAPWDWRQGARVAPMSAAATQALPQRFASAPASDTLQCGSKRYCREMASCAEANYYLRNCGLTSIDGNGDGEPCERLCGTLSK